MTVPVQHLHLHLHLYLQQSSVAACVPRQRQQTRLQRWADYLFSELKPDQTYFQNRLVLARMLKEQ